MLHFFLSFTISLLFTQSFLQNELPKKVVEQKTVTVKKKSVEIKRRNCVPVEPSLEKNDKDNSLHGIYAESIRNKKEILAWLQENADASQEAKAEKRRELKLIERRIADVKGMVNSINERHGVSQNLLYLEKCYEF